MYSRITAHTKSWNAFFRIRATSFLPQTAGKEQRVWPLCELVRFDYSIYNRNLSISRLFRRFFAFYDMKKDGYMSPSLTAKNKNRLKRRLIDTIWHTCYNQSANGEKWLFLPRLRGRWSQCRRWKSLDFYSWSQRSSLVSSDTWRSKPTAHPVKKRPSSRHKIDPRNDRSWQRAAVCT